MTSNIDVVATYTINSYDVIYRDHDGAELQRTSYEYNADLTGHVSPVNPTRIGYTFSSWSNALPLSMPASNVEITAQYNINSYTLQFIDDSGVLYNDTFEYGVDISGITLPSPALKVGYTFNSWDQTLPGIMPANNVVITATYTIAYETDQSSLYTGFLL